VTFLPQASAPLVLRPDSADGRLTAVVVDAHAPIREGLPLLLGPEGIHVLATASTGGGAEAILDRHEPDVVLVSLELPDVDGLVLLRRLVRRGSRSAVVLYVDEERREHASAAMREGAAGVVAKRQSTVELATALRAIAAGGLWFGDGAELSASPPAVLFAEDDGIRRTATLSDAERRVLALVAHGSSTEEMAGALSLSPHTVRTHLRNVMRKLEASSRAHAVAIAIREAAIPV
jgi:DNA-binding NarL/FixJ family response regulator